MLNGLTFTLFQRHNLSGHLRNTTKRRETVIRVRETFLKETQKGLKREAEGWQVRKGDETINRWV
jgi:hypothetical protein